MSVHPSSELPEALRIAEFFESFRGSSHAIDGKLLHVAAAAELRRLHAECEALRSYTERLAIERDVAQARYDRTVAILVGIHRLLYPSRVSLADGRVMEFQPNAADANEWMNLLSERIRAIPDELELSARTKDHP